MSQAAPFSVSFLQLAADKKTILGVSQMDIRHFLFCHFSSISLFNHHFARCPLAEQARLWDPILVYNFMGKLVQM